MKKRNKYIEILQASTKLGLTSFGGPAAHIGYFREEYVKKRKWISDEIYADLVALCQFLPGPASSQVGIAIGMIRGGLLGGILSWIGFTFPSVVFLMLAALLITSGNVVDHAWIHGLKIVAVAVVAQALIGMHKSLTPDWSRRVIASLAAIVVLLFPTTIIQTAVIVLAGIVGAIFFKKENVEGVQSIALTFGKKVALFAWIALGSLLIFLPLLNNVLQNTYTFLMDTFFRVGSIVFGGGHVVLPMLEREVVPNGWMTTDTFIAGYGLAQAVPGPLFTLAAYVGQVTGSFTGAIVAVVAMFLPSFLLLLGTLPFWSYIRTKPSLQAALKGVNAAVLGVLFATFINPIVVSAVTDLLDVLLIVGTFMLLVVYKLSPWKVVVIGAIIGAIKMNFFS